MTTTRTLSLTLIIALFVFALGGCHATVAEKGDMFDPESALVHREALDAGISDACAAALLAVENEFAGKALIERVDQACHEEVKGAIAAEKFSEQGADGGTIALDPILGTTLFVEDGGDDSDDNALRVIGAVPGRFTGTGE